MKLFIDDTGDGYRVSVEVGEGCGTCTYTIHYTIESVLERVKFLMKGDL